MVPDAPRRRHGRTPQSAHDPDLRARVQRAAEPIIQALVEAVLVAALAAPPSPPTPRRPRYGARPGDLDAVVDDATRALARRMLAGGRR
mgnify:FL=1